MEEESKNFESYILAQNKQDFLKTLIPGTVSHYFFNLLHALNTQEKLSSDAQTQLKDYVKQYTNLTDTLHIEIKVLMKEYDHKSTSADRKKQIIKELNERFLHLKFDYSKPSFISSSTLKTDEVKRQSKFDLEKLKLKEQIEKAYKDRRAFDLFQPQYYHHFDTKKISEAKIDIFEQYLKKVDPTSIDNYLDLVVKYAERSKPISQKVPLKVPRHMLTLMTLDQLEGIKKKIPDLIKDQDFINELFFREFRVENGKKVGQGLDKAERREVLLQVYNWAKELPAVTQSLAYEALDEILQIGIDLNKFSKDLFIEYLKRPARIYNNATKNHQLNLNQYRNSVSWSFFHKEKWISQDTLIKTYLEELFKDAENFKPFDEYLENSYLKTIYYSTKLLKGDTIPDINTYLSSSKLRELADSKELGICKHNQEFYRENDPVTVTLQIKNIPNLLVKVFEFCPENYYLKNKKQIDGTLNLDGLIASEEYTYEFKQPPVIKFVQQFTFESITKKPRGVYIIDFIGNGLSTRAIIKKSKLSLIEKQTVAGQSFHIVDENKNICHSERTGIWVDGKFHNANDKGEILIPFGKKNSSTHAIIVHDGFSELQNIDLKTENFQFKCSYIYNNESLLMGNKARVLLQPRLFVNNHPVGLDIMKDCTAVVTTYSETNIPTHTKFENIKFVAEEEYPIDFPIPAKLQSVEIKVTGAIPKVDSQDEHKFSSQTNIPFNLHHNTMEFVQIYLKYTNEGYELYALGKNGEPKPSLDMTVYLKHKFFSTELSEILATDQNGRVFLGKLDDIVSIRAQLAARGDINYANQSWKINDDKKINYPATIHICEGDAITLPVLNNQNDKNTVSFLETLPNQTPLKDRSSQVKIENRTLSLQGLKEGTYKLTLKEAERIINITVLKGQYWKHGQNYVHTEKSLFHIKNQINNIVIENIDVKADEKDAEKATINIKAFVDDAHLARFHIFGSQFLQPNMTKAVKSLDANRAQIPFQEIPIGLRASLFLNNRQLGDEYVYVLDRKNKTRYIGNTLERPQVLLKRTFVQNTTTRSEDLAPQDEFTMDRENLDRIAAEPQGVKNQVWAQEQLLGASSSVSGLSESVESFMNFLESPSFVASNLKPGQDGTITIKDFPIKKFSYIHIIASNLTSNISQIHPLPKSDIPTKDVSLKSQLKKESFYSINRGSTTLSKGTSYNCKDLTSTDMQIVDSIPKLFDIQKSLMTLQNGSDVDNGENYDFWKFLKEWDTLDEATKLKKYDKFNCHEVNLFLYFKAPEFFKNVVKPFITNKIEKTLIDNILLDNEKEVLEFTQPGQWKNLNPLEASLLVYALKAKYPQKAKAIAQGMEYLGKAHKIATNVFKRRFDTVLNSKTEEEKEAIGAVGGGGGRASGARGGPPRAGAPHMAQNIMMTQNINMNMNAMPIQQNYQQQAMPSSYGVQRNMINNYEPMMQQQQQFGGMQQQQDMLLERSMPVSSMQYNNALDYDYSNQGYAQQRHQIRQGFKELENTKEYCERHYYKKTHSPHFDFNPFWSDLATHIIEKGLNVPFLTQNFIHANSSHTEMLAVLSFMGLPFKAGSHNYKNHEGRGVTIEGGSDAVVLHKEISEGKADLKPEILISQRFFDPKDRYTQQEDDPGVEIEKEVDQYVINKIYGCKVTVTNVSVASQEVQILIEIPEGSIPVHQIDYTKSHTVKLPSSGNSTIEAHFYFPQTGNYKVYPSNVSKNGKVMAQATEKNFTVEAERKFTSLESFTAVLTQGSQDDILEFVRTKNILDSSKFDFSQVWWLLKDKAFFTKYIQVLRDRSVYDSTTWTFGFYHNDEQTIQEYLERSKSPNIYNKFKFINSSLIKQDKFKVLEYSPYVNPRVHVLASEKNQILNIQLKQQYSTYVRYMAENPNPEPQHYLGLVYYLLLQDRIDEAILFFNKINANDIKKTKTYELQYDYFAAYLDFYTGFPKFTVAREICLRYLAYPVLSWRSLFIDIANQLAEFDGDEMIQDEAVNDSDKKQNVKNAEKEEIITMELENTRLNITYQNIKEITVFFYKIDLEILFSRNPFLSQSRDDFAYIMANSSHKVTIENSSELQKAQYEIPPDLQKSNVYIQLRTENKNISKTYFSTSLKVQIIENYGQVKVLDENEKPLTKVYVKTFAKDRSGKVSFYKDGYTDLRGRFDYATLNSSNVSNISKFAILVMSDEHGSLTKEANPPSTVGKVENNMYIRSKNKAYAQYQADPIQQEYIKKKKF